jgi:4-hydroxy-tetrahydrodipicolinate reductase
MRVSIVGFGGMGKILLEAAKEQGIGVHSIIDPSAEGATHREISTESVANADVCIDFTTPEAVLENIEKYCELKKNAVIATTGWYDSVEKVKEMVDASGIGLVYASNFSVGVNAFFRVVEQAARIMNSLPEYDVLAFEMHHNRKKDSPSGTAKSLEKILLENIGRKSRAVEEKLDRKIEAGELHFASVRGGDIPGTHCILFDSSFDTIELKHTARNRKGFALGALKAAEFVNGKKGFFSIGDLMKEIIQEEKKHG